jgi:hypothetical protein
MATPAQIKFIHVLIGKLSLPDEHYRDMLSAYNVSSSTALTMEGANELIDGLIKLAADRGIDVITPAAASFKKSDAFSYVEKLGSRRGYATSGQLKKIIMLWWQASCMKTDAGKWEALRTFIRNKWEIERFEWLPIELVGKIIKTIEAMVPREQSTKENEHAR